MVNGLWGRKLGMAQIFTTDKKVVPVTVIDVNNWVVTHIKTNEKDGYNALQVGYVRPRYHGKPLSAGWLKSKKTYFEHVCEVLLTQAAEGIKVGSVVPFQTIFSSGETVDVVGTSKGCGFAGAMRRHGFSGGPSSHGSMFHRRTGSASFMRSRGRVIKGKRFPGHMGVARRTIKNLTVVSLDPERNVLLVKGSVPGKPGSSVFVRKMR